jgi:fumarate reductase subunit C
MEEGKPVRKSEPGPENGSRLWRPWRPPRRQTRWWALWAVGMVTALGAIALLVAKLYPGIWDAISGERVATLIGIVVALTVIIVLLALGGSSLGWTGFGEKKLWDWLQLLSALAIPVVVALATTWFSSQQSTIQIEVEEQRAQDEALQAYLIRWARSSCMRICAPATKSRH